MRQNPHVRICGGPGSATTLVYPTDQWHDVPMGDTVAAQLVGHEPHGFLSLTVRCFCHQLLLPRPYLVLTKPLRLDIQCQRGASVKIGWKYLDD